MNNTFHRSGDAMPHLIVKLWPGKSERQKQRLAQMLSENVQSVLQIGADSVSVAFEEVRPGDWVDQVYAPDIQAKWDKLYIKPGYTAADL